jgi:hypothetical protein
MKAKELIDVLQKLDPETLIVVNGYEGDYDVPKGAERIYVTGPHETKWYYGDYKDCPEDEQGAMKALYLMR